MLSNFSYDISKWCGREVVKFNITEHAKFEIKANSGKDPRTQWIRTATSPTYPYTLVVKIFTVVAESLEQLWLWTHSDIIIIIVTNLNEILHFLFIELWIPIKFH